MAVSRPARAAARLALPAQHKLWVVRPLNLPKGPVDVDTRRRSTRVMPLRHRKVRPNQGPRTHATPHTRHDLRRSDNESRRKVATLLAGRKRRGWIARHNRGVVPEAEQLAQPPLSTRERANALASGK